MIVQLSLSLSLFRHLCIASMLNIRGCNSLPGAGDRGKLGTVPIGLGAILCIIGQISIWSSLVLLFISVSLPQPFPIRISLSLQILHPCLPPTSAASCPALIPRIFRAGCSHHRHDSCSPVFWSSARHKSIIGRVAMYCATVFWWRAIYTPISSSPTVDSSAPMVGYTHVPSRWLLVPMSDIRRTARWW